MIFRLSIRIDTSADKRTDHITDWTTEQTISDIPRYGPTCQTQPKQKTDLGNTQQTSQ